MNVKLQKHCDDSTTILSSVQGIKNLEEALSAETIARKKNLYLCLFPKEFLHEIDAQYIVDKCIQTYKTLRKYMIYEEVRKTNPRLFRTIGFNSEDEFTRIFEDQKKEIKLMIQSIQPYVKEDLTFLDTLVEKDPVNDIKDVSDIEKVRERLIQNEELTDEEKTVLLGYITLKKADDIIR